MRKTTTTSARSDDIHVMNHCVLVVSESVARDRHVYAMNGSVFVVVDDQHIDQARQVITDAIHAVHASERLAERERQNARR